MTLTGKQRSELKALSQSAADDARLGKAELSAGFLTNLRDLLARKELVKLRFGKDFQGDLRQSLADELCAATGAQCVAILGRTMLLYKPNPDLPAERRVIGDP